jgi:hypothetical protein
MPPDDSMPQNRLDIFTAFNVLARELVHLSEADEPAVRAAAHRLRRGFLILKRQLEDDSPGLIGETAAEHIRNAQMMLQCAKDAMPKGSEDVALSLTAYDAIACRLGLALGAL